MDTKLKNNKKALRTAVIILVLAALCFVLLSIQYKGKVDAYYAESGGDFEDEIFIRVLFQCNYALYPELLEKSGKNFRAEDLYLSFEEETAEEAVYYGNEEETGRDAGRVKADCILSVQQSLDWINELYTEEISRRIDYCVIDRDTQTILKNTAKNIELLRDGKDAGYAYYLIVCYDANGIISDISVSGVNAELFLKNAQLVAYSTDSLLFTDSPKVMSYALVNDSGTHKGRITVTQKSPENAVFIYAMTQEQLEDFSWIPVYTENEYGIIDRVSFIGGSNKELIYNRLGIGWVYLLFLAVITGIFFVLARRAPQLVADTAGTGWYAELIIFVQCILLSLGSTVITLVCNTNERSGIVQFPLKVRYAASYAHLFLVMFVLFGVWYWCLLSIRGIFCGFRSFIRERSILYRKWKQVKGFFGGIRNRWKRALSDVDLGKSNTRLLRLFVLTQFVILSIVSCFWFVGIFAVVVYSFILYMELKLYIGKVQKQYRNLMQATNAIAQGKFDNDFNSDFGIFESYKKELYQIQDGFGKAVEEEVKSQRMKTELITNVSHDLKTPLTAIITYIDLLKDENITDGQRRSYLDTLEKKSLRLKVLIEDLFEISKASSGNVKLEPVSVDICSLMRQVYLEHEEKMTEKGLDVRFDLPEEKVVLQLDSQKTYRIFENLYMNIIKYAMPNTRVYIQAKRTGGAGVCEGIYIEIKNISAEELTVNPTDLTERFVRGDASRNTEGSGLGLAIAKSFTQLQGGRFAVETDGDLFKAVIEWRETNKI